MIRFFYDLISSNLMSFTYQVIKSEKRKTVALQIKNGQVIVRAPYAISDDHLNDIINKKSPWIQAKLELYKQRPATIEPSCFSEGDKVWFLGRPYLLHINFTKDKGLNSEERVLLACNTLTVHVSHRYQQHSKSQQKKAVKNQLESFFKEQSEYYLSEHLPTFIDQTNLIPSRYQVRRYKARWGSCNNKKELSFNYLLMMVPSFVFDYVIIHELCHIQHLNHSANFWALVSRYCPHYQEAKTWLKQHQRSLHWQ